MSHAFRPQASFASQLDSSAALMLTIAQKEPPCIIRSHSELCGTHLDTPSSTNRSNLFIGALSAVENQTR